MHTSIEHLAKCPTCRRRTLHRHVVVLGEAGDVVSDERLCIACVDRGQRSTAALQLQRAPRSPGRKAAPKRKSPKTAEEQSPEEQSDPGRWTRQGGAA